MNILSSPYLCSSSEQRFTMEGNIRTNSNPLPRSFYDRPTLRVAKDLLGKYLLRETTTGLIESRIVDVEAYVGPNDRACHASKGRTKRTEVLFGPAGMTYVYLIYGMYNCLNLVTERIDFPAAILIRGLEVRRNSSEDSDSLTRIDGPGRVCRFLEIDRSLNGWDTTRGRWIWIEDRKEKILPKQIQSLPRIRVDYAGKWAKKLWRFCLDNPSLASRKKPAPTKEVRKRKYPSP